MRACVIACVALCALSLSHQRARAEPLDPGRAHRGTHFLAELDAGLTPGGSAGPAGALLFGGGGRPRTTSLRLYALGELSFAHVRPALAVRAPSVRGDERSYFGLAAGMRLYIPTVGRLRVFLDALAGGSYNTAEITTDATVLAESDWFVQGTLAGGLQYRLMNALSLGARVKWTASSDPLSDVRERLGLSGAFPWAATGTATWHF